MAGAGASGGEARPRSTRNGDRYQKPTALVLSAIIALAPVATYGDDWPDAPRTAAHPHASSSANSATKNCCCAGFRLGPPTRTLVAVVAVEFDSPNLRMPA